MVFGLKDRIWCKRYPSTYFLVYSINSVALDRMADHGLSSYGSWSVARLKEELASRGAPSRGKKKE